MPGFLRLHLGVVKVIDAREPGGGASADCGRARRGRAAIVRPPSSIPRGDEPRPRRSRRIGAARANRGARENWPREGLPAATIHVTGNTIVDALSWIAAHGGTDRAQAPRERMPRWRRYHDKKLIFVTAHRRESHGEPLADICRALRLLAETGQFQIVFPVHRDPNVWEPLHAALGGIAGIDLLPPVDYLTVIARLSASWLALTDSGGIQEEAPSFKVPVLVMRQATERTELTTAGAGRLVGTSARRILEEVQALAGDREAWERMRAAVNPFGDGRACERIADVLVTGTCTAFRPGQTALDAEPGVGADGQQGLPSGVGTQA